jgi:hypothetical protein
MAASERVIIVTPPGVASYVHLFEAYSESGKYQLNIIFPPTADLKALEEEVDRVAKEKWPKGLPKKFQHPFRDADEKAEQAGYDKGGTFICPKSVNKPKVFARDKTRIDDPSEIYAGALVRASVTAFAYDTKGNVGVSFGLVNVQKLGDGTPLTGVQTEGDELDELEDDLADVL